MITFMVKRDILLQLMSLAFLLLSGCTKGALLGKQELVLNDVHSRLNATAVAEIHYPRSTEDVVNIIQRAKQAGQAISISGGRHAMGQQQFGDGTVHISMKEMNDVLFFDREKGIVQVEAGVEWPKLVAYLTHEQQGVQPSWGIVQKPTGADSLSIGGALSANVHGRGVRFKPIIQDVEAFTLVDGDGKILQVSRTENSELFGLAIGGYGLFGVIATVDLRLQPRKKIQRTVEVVTTDALPQKVANLLTEEILYGDFQYKTDAKADDFMQVGVFTTYKPVPQDTPLTENPRQLTSAQWYQLLHLAHTDKGKAFDHYRDHYLKTSGQIYWSDTHQLSFYVSDYIEYLEKMALDYPKGSLMITEVYVPRERFNDFVAQVMDDIRERDINVIYGTMRLIERDDESFLAWARQNYACIIFNLRVEHSEAGLSKAQEDFRQIIDRALEVDGSYYLTYHRWARKDQVLKAYPQFPEFLKLKRKYDPEERFQSEWYRHYKKMFAQEIRW
jgi:FAD/FMN-containing dehydrogenase